MTHSINKLPKISVLMSVYNDERYLSKAIKSILNQTFSNFEFIIINDGSTDNSYEVIKQYAANDKRLIPITQNNIGLTKSLNKGIQIARGEYIARQDADDYSSPDRFVNQLSIMESKKKIGVLASSYYVFSKKENFRELLKPRLIDFPRKNIFAHGSLMFRALLLKNNPYDERYVYAQDYELLYRLYSKTKFFILPKALYYLRKDLIYNLEKYQFYLQINKYSLRNQCIPIIKPANPRDIPALKRGMEKRYYDFLATILRRRKRFEDAFEMYNKVPNPLSIKEKLWIFIYSLLKNCQLISHSLSKK